MLACRFKLGHALKVSDLKLPEGVGVRLAQDMRNQSVVLFPSKWAMDYFLEKRPGLVFHHISPHDLVPGNQARAS